MLDIDIDRPLGSISTHVYHFDFDNATILFAITDKAFAGGRWILTFPPRLSAPISTLYR